VIKYILSGASQLPYGLYIAVAVVALVLWFIASAMFIDWINEWFAKIFRRK
jgi:hypothetical protein